MFRVLIRISNPWTFWLEKPGDIEHALTTFPSRKYFYKGARIVHFLAFCRFALNKALIFSTLKPNAFRNVGKNADQDFLNFPILWENVFFLIFSEEGKTFVQRLQQVFLLIILWPAANFFLARNEATNLESFIQVIRVWKKVVPLHFKFVLLRWDECWHRDGFLDKHLSRLA